MSAPQLWLQNHTRKLTQAAIDEALMEYITHVEKQRDELLARIAEESAERDAVNTIAKRQSAILTRTGDELADCRTEIAALKAECDTRIAQLERQRDELVEVLKYCRQKIAYMTEHGEWYSPGRAIEMADAAIASVKEKS